MKRTQSYWRLQSRGVIQSVHASLPDSATLKERQKAVDDAYPFGPREYHPYKMWLIERRAYLERYGYQSKAKPKHGKNIVAGERYETPLERLMRRGGA